MAGLGVVLEYVALSVMIPLSGVSQGASGIAIKVNSIWYDAADWVGLPSESRTWLWLFLLLLGLRITVGFAQVSLNTWVSKRVLAHLSGGTFARVVMFEPISEIYRRSVGHYTSLAGDEAVRVGQVFFHLAQTVSALFAAAIGLFVLFIFSVSVFKLTMLFLLLSATGIGLAMRRVLGWSQESAILSREANTTFIEGFNGIRSIRSMAGESFVADRYRNFIERYGRVLFLLDVFSHGSRSLPGLLLIGLGLVLLFPAAGFFPDFSAFYFLSVTTMLMRVLSFLGAAVSSGGRVSIDIRAAFDLEEIIGEPDAAVNQGERRQISAVSTIHMSSLSCGYKTGHPVLTGVCAELQAGRCYVLMGKSGSGKSTLSDVLLGLLPPLSGSLQIDGLDYQEVDLESLRRKVVLVEQQTRIFSGSLRENITFGLIASDRDIDLAVDIAGLREFVKSLPRGLETRLDYQGANLSGGQKQRIGLARAVVRDPDVLILDEATSALDSHTRDQILDRLKAVFKEKILLLITHDQHVMKLADEVWSIQKGRLITHATQ